MTVADTTTITAALFGHRVWALQAPAGGYVATDVRPGRQPAAFRRALRRLAAGKRPCVSRAWSLARL